MYAFNFQIVLILLLTISSVYTKNGKIPSEQRKDRDITQRYVITEDGGYRSFHEEPNMSKTGGQSRSRTASTDIHNTQNTPSLATPSSAASTGSILNTPILQAMLQNPDMMSMLMKYMGSSTGGLSSLPMLLQFITGMNGEGSSSMTSLTSIMEEMISELQYVRSPEGLTNEDQCVSDFSAYVQGLQETQMWALQMFDASGKPEKSILQGALRFLGNYDECLGVSHITANTNKSSSHVIKGNYCHLVFTLPQSVLNVTSDKMPFSLGEMTLQWDLCLPMSCNDSQVMEAVSQLPLNSTGMSLVSAHFIQQKDWKEDNVAVASVVVLCVVVLLSVIGTLYDVITTEIRTKREKKENEGGNINNGFIFDHNHLDQNIVFRNGAVGYVLETEKITQVTNSIRENHGGFGRQLLLSFSVSKNTEKILNTKTGESNLGCIHGIRVLSMAWVILGHSMTWDSMRSWENVITYANWMRRFTMQFLVNGTLSVDTFFVLSGCLVTYLFLKETKRSSTGRPTVRQMVLYYVHRWWRLTPVYMFIVLLYSGLLDHLINGPMAEGKNLIDPDNCRENWWTNILYINDFYSYRNMCMPASWFLAQDMQFYVIAPAALLPLAFGVSWLGYTVIALLLATHITSYGYMEWETGGSTQFVNNGESMEKIYRIPWCRVGVFAIGMFLGVILQKTKCKVRIPRFALLLGWQVFLTIGLLCTYVTYDDFRNVDSEWDVNIRIIHETLFRPGWGLFVSWIIFVCCTGYGGFMDSILSWSAWIPLGRLTYGAYLIHPVLLSYTEFSTRTLVYADIPHVSYHFIGTFAVSYALSFIACVLVEAPCMGLEKAVLTKLKMKK